MGNAETGGFTRMDDKVRRESDSDRLISINWEKGQIRSFGEKEQWRNSANPNQENSGVVSRLTDDRHPA